MDGITYHQLLAQQYAENERNTLLERESESETEYTVEAHRGSKMVEHFVENPDAFRAFPGNRNMEEDVLKPQAFEDKSKLSVRYSKDVRTYVFNIDSRFRAYASPTPGVSYVQNAPPTVSNALQSSAHFVFRLNRQLKNAISIKMSSLELPNTFANFSESRGNSSFGVRVHNATPYFTKVDIAPFVNGVNTPKYFPTPTLLVYAVQNALRGCGISGAENFTCTINPGGFVQIGNSSSNPTVSYDFDFTTNVSTPSLYSSSEDSIPKIPQLFDSLGTVLGFSENYYNVVSSAPVDSGTEASIGAYGTCSEPCNIVPIVTGTYLPDTNTDEYIYLAVNDYSSVTPQTLNNTYFPVFAKIPMSVDKGKQLFDTDSSNSTRKLYNFLQPTNIQTLDIQLLDRTGALLSNVGEYSLTLEIEEVVSQALYEKLREL
jgi:hypothetical protein